MAAWYERFFEGLYGRVLARQFDGDTTGKQARLIRRLLRVRRGQRVLDVPCGQGRITLPLARSGLAMTGVDLTSRFLDRARRQARRDNLEANFLKADMREIDFEEEFDAVFNWFGSFGYFSDADNLEFCRRVLKALKPGGRFLLEGLNKNAVRAHFRRSEDSTIGGVRVITGSRWLASAQRVRSTWTFKRGGKTERHTIEMRLFDGAGIRAFLRSVGFGEVRLYGPGGSRFTRYSRRIIAVARKAVFRSDSLSP